MAGDHEGRALQVGVGQRAAQRLHRGKRLGADVGRVVVEGDFEIDIRLVLGDGRDLLALGDRQRARGAAADVCDELGFRGVRRPGRLCGPTDRPRVSGAFFAGVSALTIWSSVTSSPARAWLCRSESAAPMVDDRKDCGENRSCQTSSTLPVPPARASARFQTSCK